MNVLLNFFLLKQYTICKNLKKSLAQVQVKVRALARDCQSFSPLRAVLLVHIRSQREVEETSSIVNLRGCFYTDKCMCSCKREYKGYFFYVYVSKKCITYIVKSKSVEQENVMYTVVARTGMRICFLTIKGKRVQ